MDNGITFDGVTEIPCVAPTSVAELGGLVHRAAAEKTALFPFGGRTMFDLGTIPSKAGTGVDLRKLDQVIDYPARDMTITVQAGITIGKLRDILKGERQRLAVDIPLPDRATLGGAIAANASGPRRFGLGTLRDYVIGISVVNDEGNEIKGGGRVVKNVAGYDLMKLYTGSLGTLGIITQVTLKLKPEPEASKLLSIPVTLEQAGRILDGLGGSRTRPVCIELLDPTASRHLQLDASAWNLIIGFEDNAKAVDWQIEQIQKELPAECAPREQDDNLWNALTDFALWPEATLSFKANLLPSATVEFCRQASPLAVLQAHAGNGIVIGHLKETTLDGAGGLLEKLGALAAEARGNLIVTRCPAGWKKRLPIWGRSTGDRVLMRAVKDKLDPGRIFNPGRFVDGI